MTPYKHSSARIVKSGRKPENATRFSIPIQFYWWRPIPPQRYPYDMNPQVPGYPTGAPPAWGAGAPAGATVVAPPAYAPPQPPQPAPPNPRRRPGWITVWTMFTVALLLAATAVALSVAELTTDTATTTTVAAAPPAPTFSPDQVAAAKREACDASKTAATTVLNAQQSFAVASRDRLSPQYRPALGNFQLVVAIETKFMEQRLKAATPKAVTDATNDYINAFLSLADANTRELSNQDADQFVDAVERAGTQLDKVCE
jgi:hypothetical protein